MISTPFVLLIRSSIDIYIQSSIDVHVQSRIELYMEKIGARSVNKKLTLRQIFVDGASVGFIDCGKCVSGS